MYYLRKEPYKNEFIDPITNKVDFVNFTADRAIFKHNRFGKFYRMDYLCTDKDVHLWKVKSLQKALQHRLNTWYYCREWFDIYDESGKISEEKYLEYKPVAIYKAKTTRTLYYSEEEGEIVDDKPKYGYYETYRSGTVLNIYKWLDWYQEWNFYKDFNERSEKERQLVAVTNSGKHLFTFSDASDLLEENCWLEVIY